MPEGGEVAVFADSLNKLFKGQYLISYSFNQKFKHTRDLEVLPAMNKLLEVVSRGKKIIFKFSDGFLLSSLGLEGSWYLGDERSSTHFTSLWGEKIDGFFKLTEVLSYADFRSFGWLEFFKTEEELEKRLDIGIDLLKDPPDFPLFKSTLAQKKKTSTEICSFLLDQKYFSSIGNYLRSEILYDAKIHPRRTIGSLSENDLRNLWSSSLRIVKESYEQGGASLQTYKDLFGKLGTYKTIIYGNTKDPLGNEIKKEKDKDGRTIWFVPSIQK